ncbi:MAG: acetyltransferase [Sphingomonadales bacterium]|nr:acetyltransferase [Sphingomonadales bacterium]
MGVLLPHREFRGRVSDLHTFDLPNGADLPGGKSITVRLADCDGERSTANMLINRKYARRGYGAHHKVPTASNCVTFTATSKGATIGTLSLTVDSPDGLACDKTFKEELDKFRAVPGARLCELTRFAFDTSKPSLHLLASLFHIIFIYGTHHYQCTDLFIEVASRHRRFYQAMLGFHPVCEPKVNDAVGVPSNLMWLKVSDIRQLIDRHTKEGVGSSHSLYSFFFSEKEELGIYNRLANNAPEPAPRVNGKRFAEKVERVLGRLPSKSSLRVDGRRRTGPRTPALA